MKHSAHLIISIFLALHFSAASAGGDNAKPGKNPGSSAKRQQSTATQENGERQSQPGDSANRPEDNDRDNDWERERDRERDRDGDRNRDSDRVRGNDPEADDNWESERDRERDLDSDRGQQGKGNERSREMLERRDERKEIKSEYKRERTPGQEGRSGKDADDDSAREDASKPWYKFWD